MFLKVSETALKFLCIKSQLCAAGMGVDIIFIVSEQLSVFLTVEADHGGNWCEFVH